MSTPQRWFVRACLGLPALLAILALSIRLRYGAGSEDFPNLIGPPIVPAPSLEEVASFELPPGNVAVSAEGRIFVSLHPEGRPTVKVVEWVAGHALPYPAAEWQAPRGREPDGRPLPYFDSVLGVRIDRKGRLWTLDNANHGFGQPRLLAFDLRTNTLVHHWDVPKALAPLGSHLNDLQVTPDGRHVLIADASIFGLDPALLVYDTETSTGRRLLSGHRSVKSEPFVPVVGGRAMRVFGLFTIRAGIDSIALDRNGEWLYFCGLPSRRLFRARLTDLLDNTLGPPELAGRVEDFVAKPMSDGLSTDLAGNVLLTDFPHDAIQLLAPDGSLRTLVRDPRLRWPDGLSFGPDPASPKGPADWLYITASALHQVLGRTPGQIRTAGPYQLFRVRVPVPGIAGH